MEYTIRLFDRVFNPKTTLTKKSFFELEYTNDVNKSGNAEFSVNVADIKSTPDNLKLFNRVKIYKGGVFKFVGYIEELNVTLTQINIRVSGLLNVLKNRNVFYNTIPGELLTDEFYKILQMVNTSNDTGITQGTSTAVSTLGQTINFRGTSALSALQKLASLENKVLYINENNQLDLIDESGTDKSNVIIFNFDVNQLATANIDSYEVDTSGKDLANVVIAKSKSISASVSDPASIALFGEQVKRINSAESTSIQQLTDEAQSYLDIHKQEFIVPTIKPNSIKIDPDSYDIGDTVTVSLNNGFLSINAEYLITQKKVRLSESNIDDVDIKVTQVGSNVLPSDFLTDIVDLQKRMTITEGFLLE